MLAFKYAKHPDSIAWYEVRFQEPLTGTPTVVYEPNPHSNVSLDVQFAGLAEDSSAVRFRVGGGSNGTVWILDVHVTTADGSQLVVPVRLAVSVDG
jgi:hypothetical protein